MSSSRELTTSIGRGVLADSIMLLTTRVRVPVGVRASAIAVGRKRTLEQTCGHEETELIRRDDACAAAGRIRWSNDRLYLWLSVH